MYGLAFDCPVLRFFLGFSRAFLRFFPRVAEPFVPLPDTDDLVHGSEEREMLGGKELSDFETKTEARTFPFPPTGDIQTIPTDFLDVRKFGEQVETSKWKQ